MSILVGVQGSNREKDGQAIREGIAHHCPVRHQPTPLFNGSNSSSIWGNPHRPLVWQDHRLGSSSFSVP
eukprot:c36361_g1_i1 orf=265-471(+)